MKALDRIMLILTLSICIVLIASNARVWFGHALDADSITQVVMALIAIISLYVGSKLKSKDE